MRQQTDEVERWQLMMGGECGGERKIVSRCQPRIGIGDFRRWGKTGVDVIRIGDVVETSPKLTPNAAALRGDTGEGLGARCENGRDARGKRGKGSSC